MLKTERPELKKGHKSDTCTNIDESHRYFVERSQTKKEFMLHELYDILEHPPLYLLTYSSMWLEKNIQLYRWVSFIHGH